MPKNIFKYVFVATFVFLFMFSNMLSVKAENKIENEEIPVSEVSEFCVTKSFSNKVVLIENLKIGDSAYLYIMSEDDYKWTSNNKKVLLTKDSYGYKITAKKKGSVILTCKQSKSCLAKIKVIIS